MNYEVIDQQETLKAGLLISSHLVIRVFIDVSNHVIFLIELAQSTDVLLFWKPAPEVITYLFRYNQV